MFNSEDIQLFFFITLKPQKLKIKIDFLLSFAMFRVNGFLFISSRLILLETS